jgi:hypothetical protein
MGKNKKALSKKEQAALKTASAKRVAEQEEGPRIPRKAPKNTGRTRAATTEDVLADMAGQDSETDDSEDEEDAADEDHGSVDYGSVAKPVARRDGNEYGAIIGRGAGQEPLAVQRKAVYVFAVEELGRPLRAGEFEVIVECSPTDLKALGVKRGKDIVKLVDGSKSCNKASREIADMIMMKGHNITDAAIVIVGLAALDQHFSPGGQDFIGAQTREAVDRRLETLQQLEQMYDKSKEDTRGGADQGQQRGEGGGLDPSLWTSSQEVASFSRADEDSVASTVEANRRKGGGGSYSRAQATQVLKAVRATTSNVGKSLCAQAASRIRKVKPAASETAINKLARGTPTAGEMENTAKKASGVDADARTDMMLLMDVAWTLEQIDKVLRLELFRGATIKLLKMNEMMGRVDEAARREHVVEFGEIYFKCVHLDLQQRLEQLLFEDGEVEILTAEGSLNEEIKDDVKQLNAKIKGMARRGSGAEAASPTASGGQKRLGGPTAAGASPGGTSGGGGRTWCFKYIVGECTNNAICGLEHKEKKDIDCPYLAKGSCFKGSSCDWKH